MRLLRLTPDALVEADSAASVFARISSANLALGPEQLAPGTRRLVCWSGWMGDGADPQLGRFPRDHRTWSRHGWDALARFLDTALPRLDAAGIDLLFRPHARHILADPQGCVSFFRTHASPRLGLLLDPAAFLTASMLASAEDHLARAFDALGAHPAVRAVVLTNVQRIDTSDEDVLGPAPLHRGLLDPSLMLKPWRASCPPPLPVALLDEEFPDQAAMLT